MATNKEINRMRVAAYFMVAALFMGMLAMVMVADESWRVACQYLGWTMAFWGISDVIRPFYR